MEGTNLCLRGGDLGRGWGVMYVMSSSKSVAASIPVRRIMGRLEGGGEGFQRGISSIRVVGKVIVIFLMYRD